MELIRKEGNSVILFVNITRTAIKELDKVVIADVGVRYRTRHGRTTGVITIDSSVEIGLDDGDIFVRMYDNLLYISFDERGDINEIQARV